MKTRVNVIGLLVLSLLGGMVLVVGAQEEAKPSYWMQKKLGYSEKILGGLVSKDFDEVAKNARSMNALGQIEKWVRGNTRDYRAQLQVFRNANEQLIQMADAENLDGAALAYVQLSLSCINCHKIVRDAKREAPSDAK